MNHFVSRLVAPRCKTGVDASLGAKTLVVGANEAGKSAVVAALELATTGRVDGFGAQPSALLDLAPGGKGPLVVSGELSDGREFCATIEGSTARAKVPAWSFDGVRADAPLGGLGAAFLYGEVRALMGREPKAVRAALLKAACGEVQSVAIRAAVPEAFRAEWDSFWTAAQAGAETAADALARAAGAIKAALRAAKAEAKAEVGLRPVGALADDELATLRARLEAARESGEAKRRRGAALGAIPWLESEASRLRTVAPDLAGLEFARARQRALEGAGAVLRFVLGAIRSGETEPQCLCCRAPLDAGQAASWLTALDDLAARAEQATARVEAGAQTADARLLVEVETRLAAARAEAVRPLLEGADDPVALEGQLGAALVAGAALETWEAQRREVAQAAARVDALVALRAAADRLVAESLDDALEGFCQRASAALPDGESLAIELFDRTAAGSVKEVCRVLLKRRGCEPVAWRACSGAQRARLLGALVCAWGKGRSELLRIAVADEVVLEPSRLGLVCSALAHALDTGAITQAVVCALPDAVDRVALAAAGWQVVDVGVGAGAVAVLGPFAAAPSVAMSPDVQALDRL